MAQVEMVEMEVEITPPEQMNVDVTVQSMDVDISAETMTGTVIQGIDEIKDKIDNIKLPDIDLTPVAKEATLTQGISSVEGKVEEVGNKIDNIKLPEIDTSELASKDLERFWDVVPEDSEEIISEEDIHAAVEDIWNTNF